MLRFNRRAQSTLEYAVLIFVIVAALIAMQIYVKRGMQGRLRSASDEIGEQFSPGHTRSAYDTYRTSKTREGFIAGETRRTFITDETTRTGSETVAIEKDEFWPEAAK